MQSSRLKHLIEAHRVLDKRIDGMEKTGVYNDANIEDLKKQRLKIKDQIELYKRLDKAAEEQND